MKLHLGADELLTSTRSVRKRLDLDRPVDLAAVREALEIALQAPSGGNAQAWHWVIVTDPAKKAAIADIYRTAAIPYLASRRTAEPARSDAGVGVGRASDSRTERAEAVSDSAHHLAMNLERVPLYVIPCQWGRVEGADPATVAGFHGSILPAVWSLMLALRERGIGSAWTTLHLVGDGERRTADVLGIPYEKVTQVALLPVAYTIGTHFRPARRQPLDGVLHLDRW